MKRIGCFLLLLGLLSCEKDPAPWDLNCEEGFCHYLLYKDSKVAVYPFSDGVSAVIDNGDKLVFEYQYQYKDNPNIADDEFSERLLFQIDPDLDEFILEGPEELSDALTYYNRFCFCIQEGSVAPSSGRITGRRISSSAWEIDIDVNIVSPFTMKQIQTRGVFRP